MIAKKLQRDIEAIYRLDGGPSIERFLISTQDIKQFVPQEVEPRPQVLLQEENGEVSLAVHLGDETIQRIESHGLSIHTMGDFLSAAEEISHFVYLSWSCHNDRPVSLLDVELQGEIDKFLLLHRYLTNPADLFTRLFERIAYHAELDEEKRERYVEANRLGHKFLRSLGEIFGPEGARPDALAQLRTFYREPSSTRLSKVDRL